MPTFKDQNGREWIVTIDGPKIREVRQALDLDLAAPDGSGFTKIEADVVLLVDCLWVLCREQANGLTDLQFGQALVGDAIEHATKALIDAMLDFFPARKRSLLRSLADKQAALQATGEQVVKNRLADPKLEAEWKAEMERELDKALKKLIGRNGATTLLDASDSDPTD